MAQDFGEPLVPAVEPAKSNTTTIIIIVVAVILLLCLCVCVVLFVLPLFGLSLFGPAIGDVFSEINNSLLTPIP